MATLEACIWQGFVRFQVYLLVCRLFGTEDYKKIIEETP